jgi:flagellar L-ring protein precursor FlgH
MIRNSILKWSILVFCFSMLSGCMHALDDMGLRDETIYPPTLPIDNPAPPKTNGSIYQAGHEVSLYEDHLASRVGDILTVRLEEVTQGEKKAKTKTTKLANNTMGTPVLFGGGAHALTFSTTSDQEFNGEGESNQQNKLKGTVSVSITRVLSNGNMIVQGESWVTIDQGREYVRLTGIVRREDIESNNIISSQRIVGARITYSGSGQVANSSRGGFITQLLTKFFPY